MKLALVNKSIELTDLQAECLACALADPENASAQELRRLSGANGVGGVIAALFLAGDAERAHLVNCMREALDTHRGKCLEDATAAFCAAARRAVSAAC